MELPAIVIAVLVLGGVSLAFGGLITMASRRFHVDEDPRIDAVSDMLPGSNCGACGFAGCRAFAEAVVSGTTPPARCTVMGEADREDVAAYLGVDAGEENRRVARLLCAGGNDVAPRKAIYRGIASCAAAYAASGGGKACAWGCLGLGDCAVSCTFDAIRMGETGLPLVDPDRCTACNDCVEACPLGLFVLMPADHALIVQCRNLLEGEAATDVCSVACNACGRCVQDAAPGLISMQHGLAVIDYESIDRAGQEAIARCPTSAIAWIEGAQFQNAQAAGGPPLATTPSRSASA
jgi:Na+-translocating ferredoxin:NAD+ oxidoreductase subunit B